MSFLLDYPEIKFYLLNMVSNGKGLAICPKIIRKIRC